MTPISGLHHVTVFRDPAQRYNAAFPQVAQLSDDHLVVAFRQAPFPPSVPRSTDPVAQHNHGDPGSRGAIIHSFDSGRSWDPDTLQVLVEPEGGVEQISVSAIGGDALLAPYALLRALNGPEPVYVRRSFDDGVTWDEAAPMDIRPLRGGRAHAPMLELPDETLLSPHCGPVAESRSPSGRAQHVMALIRSRDRGRTWGDGSIIAMDLGGERPYHQASLVRMPDGEIVAAMQSGGRRIADLIREMGFWISRSEDDGYTWSPVEKMPLRIAGESRQSIVTGAAHHLLMLADGRLLFTWGHRDDYTIRAAVSNDGGHTWDNNDGWVLQRGVAVRDIGEPCSTQLPDGRVVTVYYWGTDAVDPLLFIQAAIYSVGS